MLKEFDFVNVPIVDIVNAIFIDASNKGASDIHYDPWEDFMKICEQQGMNIIKEEHNDEQDV